jgi:transcriptional regulator GlxA family with amidase domain
VSRKVVFIVFDDVSALDVSGPLSIFRGATYFLEQKGQPGYECPIVTLQGGAVATDLGAAFLSRPAGEVEGRPLDTLLIPGAVDMSSVLADAEFLAWIAKHGKRARRVCSICAGALPLAASGLADGRRMVTHWAHCDALQKLRPDVKVERDPIFIHDGPVWSSAGVTAGIDLALALVEEDHGRDLAMTVARQHVVYLRRPGGQSQFSTLLEAQMTGKADFARLHEWIIERLDDPKLTVERLAEHANMRPRNFSRVYTATTGRTPGKALELFRLEAARGLLESSAISLKAVADKTGFGNPERMRTVFQRHLGISPSDYRERFSLMAG